MTTLREQYQSVIHRLQHRIDGVSYKYITTGAQSYKEEYNALVFEMCEIKQAIKESEKV